MAQDLARVILRPRTWCASMEHRIGHEPVDVLEPDGNSCDEF